VRVELLKVELCATRLMTRDRVSPETDTEPAAVAPSTH
jgi:hypothetical protein